MFPVLCGLTYHRSRGPRTRSSEAETRFQLLGRILQVTHTTLIYDLWQHFVLHDCVSYSLAYAFVSETRLF